MGKVIVTKVEFCVQCPAQVGCRQWKRLTAQERVFMSMSPQAVNILPECPLDEWKEKDDG